MLVPENEATPADRTAGATPEVTMKPGCSAEDARQTKADGSWSADDPDRPFYDRTTKVVDIFDYHHEGGRYSCSKIKGLRTDGEKVFLTGRLRGGNDLQIEKQEWPDQFYRFEGLTDYMKGKGDEPDLPFRLHDLTREKAARPDEPIIVLEGEKDANTAWAQGFIATSNPDGAMKWRDHFNDHFEGRHVVVVADNDEKGRKHAAAVARSLVPVAASVKIIDLPGLEKNGDFTDWIEAGNDRDKFQSLIAATRAERDFARDDDRKPLNIPSNVRLSLKLMGTAVRYNNFADRYEVEGLAGFGSLLDDAALNRMRLQAEERYRLTVGKDRWHDIVTDTARRRSYHPVRDMLDGLIWDGVDRLDEWLVTYAGAEDSEYVRAVGAICLIAGVRRVRVPGCKFDEMLVLEGEQGGNKSSGLATLAGREDWFADDLPLDADSKVLMERTAGRWIVELAELKGLRRGAVEHVKSMLSRQVDKARLAYGRMTTEQPRQCVFFGTTNDGQYLRDMTGNRRFWPVAVKRFDLAALRRDRDQLWAEAAAREAANASIRLPEELWAVAGAHQAGREIGDPFHDLLSERLDGWEGKVRANDVWEALGLGEVGRRTQDDNVRLSAAMQKLGWRRPKSKVRFDGRPQLAWVKGGDGDGVGAFDEVPRAVVLGLDAHGDDGRPM